MILPRTIALFLTGSVMLAGCGVNALRVASASEVGSLSTALASLAKQQLETGSRLRQQARISLIASDKSCSYNNPIYVFVPLKPGARRAPVCASSVNAKWPQYETKKLDLSPVPMETLAPTLDLIGAVAAYGEALSKIADAPKADISNEISEAIGLASRARAFATSLGASGLPDIGAISEDQQKTATDLINLFAQLAQEQRQVDSIRALVVKQKPEFLQALTKLKGQITNWNTVVSKSAAILNQGNLKRVYDSERSRLSYEAREKLLGLIVDADKESGRIKSASSAFGEAVKELRASHDDLENLLAGNLNDEQRAAAAKISRARFVQAFKLTIDALLAWKVI